MLKFVKALAAVIVLLVAAGFVFRAVYAVPEAADRIDTVSLPASEATDLGAAILPLAAEHPGMSAIAPMGQGQNAFAARMLLADAAQESIDARYYIWQRDATGLLLLDALRRAADRGVRVRLLLDDNGTPDLDAELAQLDAHPLIEVRLFNPFVLRSPRMLSYVLDFRRVNRRMHNKSFSVDGIATVVGGRNIGDIYFAHAEGVNYFDLDVVALGDAAADVATDFDLYWASPSSVPVDLVLPPAPGGDPLAAALTAFRDTGAGLQFAEAVRKSDMMRLILEGGTGFHWAEMELVSDDPAKGQGPVAADSLMISRLGRILGDPDLSVDLISAYFVPGDRLTALLSKWAGSGISVRTLTNAQEATDVLPVHGGYQKYRDALLDAGVGLYELKSLQDHPEPLYLLDQFGLIGSSKISLHAKAFAIDGDELFVGSFNFDPRSANLNTEMGFLVRSAAVTAAVYPEFGDQVERRAYRLRRGDDGGIRWLETLDDGSQVIHAVEPGTTPFSRALVRIIGWLPVTWLL